MSRTEDNLKEAFAGESQANRKYLAYAKKAEEEGLAQIARLFRAAAEAETIHAHSHLNALKGVGGTEDNLRDAIEGETHEFTSMYPQMILDAESEGESTALKSFAYANAVEKVHAALYEKALADIGKNEETDYYICKICGNTIEGSAPDVCEVCGAGKSAFYRVD